MEIEIKYVDSKTSKLTVAKDRVTLKHSNLSSQDCCGEEYILATKVVNALQKPDMLTRRGQFFKLMKA